MQVKKRVLTECILEKDIDLHTKNSTEQSIEPLRGFVHGPPGTGKSKIIEWIRRFFTEAMEWEHGVEFVFVAFQNRVAHAMKGTRDDANS